MVRTETQVQRDSQKAESNSLQQGLYLKFSTNNKPCTDKECDKGKQYQTGHEGRYEKMAGEAIHTQGETNAIMQRTKEHRAI